MQTRKPPIVELVVSVQFSTERPVDSTKLVLFWNEFLRVTHPQVSEAPPLEDTFEKFGGDVSWERRAVRLSLETLPRIRYQFTTPDRDRMVQLQATRLVFNWVRRDADYPRFSKIREEFSRLLTLWQDFAAKNQIGEVVPNQWELCYVNFIPQGELWKTPGDWHKVSKLFVSGVDAFEPLVLEDRSFQWRMKMPEDAGRIALGIQQVPGDDGQPGMSLTIAARGPTSSVEELHQRLDLAHQTILQLFDRLATTEAKTHWGMLKS